MRVKMKVAVSGARDGVSWPGIGGEIDLPNDEANWYLTAGLASPVTDDDVETAVPSPEDVETRELTESERQDPDPVAVREWAAKNGHKVAAKGQIPKAVVEAYQAAQESR
jgi:hypothetical protein